MLKGPSLWLDDTERNETEKKRNDEKRQFINRNQSERQEKIGMNRRKKGRDCLEGSSSPWPQNAACR